MYYMYEVTCMCMYIYIYIYIHWTRGGRVGAIWTARAA